jgi:helix-turn-helix protein
MVWFAAQGERVPTIAGHPAVDARTVRTWLTRFRTAGLAGLQDRALGPTEHVLARDSGRGADHRRHPAAAVGAPVRFLDAGSAPSVSERGTGHSDQAQPH